MKKSKVEVFLMHAVLLLVLALVTFPLFWVASSSLREGNTIFSGEILPRSLTFDNYRDLFGKTPFLQWLKNTILLSASSSLLCIAVTGTAGYAFSRFSFFLKRYGIMALVLIQVFPASMAMVALFKVMMGFSQVTHGMVGLNTLSGLALIYAAGGVPFSIWLFKGYIDTIPKELEESAYIDGATPWQAFFRIILPLLGPVLVVVALFNFIVPYNDFLLPSVFLTGDEKYTLAVGMRTFVTGQFATNWTHFSASCLAGALPILFLFLLLQRFLVEGLTKGAVKG